MKGDLFINNNRGNNDESLNFFMNQEDLDSLSVPSETGRRLNDYDFNILREDAYKDITDELFKLEYKISNIEKELSLLDKQIQSARDISDYDTIEYLSGRKRQLNEDLAGLIEIYNDKSLATRISGGIFKNFKKHFEKFEEMKNGIKKIIISNLPRRLSSVLELKNTLNKLENINRSVDELMTLQTPYGEGGEKYDQLSKYISKANTIQVKISKYISEKY